MRIDNTVDTLRHLGRVSHRLWLLAATVAVVALASLAPSSAIRAGTSTSMSLAEQDRAAAERAEADRAARGRTATPAPPGNDAAAQQQSPAAPSPTPTKPAPPAKPKPVGWLNQSQMDNAVAIVRTGQKAKLPERAYVVAVATAIQESKLLNLANPSVPLSLQYKSQGLGYDHDSVGLFQQRPSSGWGAPADLLNPEYAAGRFYARLVQVPNWQNLPLTAAAQAVQVSAFPYAYAQHEALAKQIVSAILRPSDGR